MKKFYLVECTLKLGGGTTVVLPGTLHQSAEDAKKEAAGLQDALAPILQCRIARPVGGGAFEDTGQAVGQYLMDLGLMAFKHGVREVEVEQKALIEVPERRILSS